MHLHNGLTHAVQLQAAYAAALGQKADSEFTGIERAGETLTPGIDLWSLPEWRYLRRERTLQTAGAEGPTVATRSRLGLENPVGSRLLSILEWVQCRAVGVQVTMTIGTGLTVDSREFMRPTDSRWYTATTGAGVTMVTHRAGAIGGVTTTFNTMLLNLGILYPLDIILQPGFFLSFDPGVDNTAINLTFRVRERMVLPGEL